MSDLGGFIPPLPLRIRVMDFHARCESMHTRLEWEERRTLLGASDISFVVNAPLEYLADEDGADSVIFIDQTLRSRDLGRRGYRSPPPCTLPQQGSLCGRSRLFATYATPPSAEIGPDVTMPTSEVF
jgi:hypothetical protein